VRNKMNFNGTFTQVIDDLVQRVMPSLVVVRGHRFGAGAGIVEASDSGRVAVAAIG